MGVPFPLSVQHNGRVSPSWPSLPHPTEVCRISLNWFSVSIFLFLHSRYFPYQAMKPPWSPGSPEDGSYMATCNLLFFFLVVTVPLDPFQNPTKARAFFSENVPTQKFLQIISGGQRSHSWTKNPCIRRV